MTKKLTCTRLVDLKERDNNGKWIIYHRPCGNPVTKFTLGQVTNANAILCKEHLRQATKQTELSRRAVILCRSPSCGSSQQLTPQIALPEKAGQRTCQDTRAAVFPGTLP